MDVVASCPENRDQRRRREKMRAPGRKEKWKRAPFHWRIKKTLAQTAPLNEKKREAYSCLKAGREGVSFTTIMS